MEALSTGASILLLPTGFAHSVIGEVMVFPKLRRGSIVPDQSAPPLRERNIFILWASMRSA